MDFATRRGDALERIAKGDSINQSEHYFRVALYVKRRQWLYEWLNCSLFVASGEREQAAVRLRFFRVA